MAKKAIAVMVFLGYLSICSPKNLKEIESDLLLFSKNLDTNPKQAHFYIERAYCGSVDIKSDSLIATTSCNYGYYLPKFTSGGQNENV